MKRLEQKLNQLVIEACKHPVNSRERQKILTKIIRLITNKLWYENATYYEDALQQTWIYFCRNLCEATTGKAYDSKRASIVTWLNSYLKRRLQDFIIERQQQQARHLTSFKNSPQSSLNDVISNIAANPYVPPLLEQVRQWAQTDKQQKLRRIYIQDHPEITAQILILRRLPPETAWKELATEFGVSVGTLSSFYQRKCLPLLREFGKAEGYLE